jgi:hypothetical protein
MENKPSLEHTPLPWQQSHRVCDEEGNYSTQVYCENGEAIANLTWYKKPQENVLVDGKPMIKTGTYRDGNASFIVKACNNHYQLLEALKNLVEDLDGESLTTGINESIQKAHKSIKQCEQ